MSILKISNPKPIPSPRLPTCFSPGDCFLHSTTSTIINHPQLGFIIRHIHIYISPYPYMYIYIWDIYYFGNPPGWPFCRAAPSAPAPSWPRSAAACSGLQRCAVACACARRARAASMQRWGAANWPMPRGSGLQRCLGKRRKNQVVGCF